MGRQLVSQADPNSPGWDWWQELTTHDGVFAVDLQQRIVYWSPSAQRLLGYQPKDVLGRFCNEMVGGRDGRNFRFCRRNCPVMVNARRGRPTPDYDIMCTLPSGETKWLNVSIAIPKKSQGDVHVIHLFRDVGRRRQLEEFARKASTALRTVLTEYPNGSVVEADPRPAPLPKLSRREIEVLRLLAAGMSTSQIAKGLSVQQVTARNHVARLLSKLGVESRLQAVVYASQRRII